LFAASNAYALHKMCLQTYAAYFRDTTLVTGPTFEGGKSAVIQGVNMGSSLRPR